jgi:hypothetical protein
MQQKTRPGDRLTGSAQHSRVAIHDFDSRRQTR